MELPIAPSVIKEQEFQDTKFKIKKFQDDFIFSKKRFPAFVGGWGTGKSLSLILRSLIYSRHIPKNLGIIFRKEFVDLRDSTCKDFEKYTGMKIDSKRNVGFDNGSILMFRHIEELAIIQNTNLGFYAIEQGDELETDHEFFMLFGRLRRQVEPDDYFKSLGIPFRSGFVIANAGDHWMRRLWKEGELEQGELIEAKTFDNKDVLPDDFLDGLEIMKKTKPEIYAQFVENDWNVSGDKFVIITNQMLEALKGLQIHFPKRYKIIACDPAMGGDECVIYVLENGRRIDTKIMFERDTMKVAGELMVMSAKHTIDDFIIDTVGIGIGIADRLSELGKRVQKFNGAQKANKSEVVNLRDLAYWYTMRKIQDKEIEYPCHDDEDLRKQLVKVFYKVTGSKGQIKLLPKDQIKKEIGRSPDRADCYTMGLYGLQYVQPWRKKEGYFDETEELSFNPRTV
jgi:hypothetical protein